MASNETRVADDAQSSVASDIEAWQSVLALCGDIEHGLACSPDIELPVATDVAARSYTLNQAAQVAGVKTGTLRLAAGELALDCFLDPEGSLRFPVYSFQATAEDPDLWEMIAGYERLRLIDLCSLLDISRVQLNSRLQQAGIRSARIIWRDVRGLWSLPETYAQYRRRLQNDGAEETGENKKKKRRRRSKAARQARGGKAVAQSPD